VYLVKMMLGPRFRMPTSAAEFEVITKAHLRRRRVFDVREMVRLYLSDDLRRGLDSIVAKINTIQGKPRGEDLLWMVAVTPLVLSMH
jgi:hypothetical protein